jgi:MOSC domain-containing protein YiiM
MSGHVIALHRNAAHEFSKHPETGLQLHQGLGIQGDAHMGATVRHRSRVAADPNQPNLRQVHLLHVEMISEICAKGFQIKPGDVGENITTHGIDLLDLPRHTRLHIGSNVILSLTGLRNPCAQLDHFLPGLTAAFLGKNNDGSLIRKAGVMAIVLEGGTIVQGDEIYVERPAKPHLLLERV